MKKIKEYIPLLATAILIICFTVFVMTTDFTGAKGDIGAMGVQGIQGIQGEKGDKGDTGDVGATGAQGIQGLQGEKGDKGDKGDTGDAGATGAAGAQGIQGIQGEKGDKGDIGEVGATGATGAQGEQGIQGEKGDKGDTGDVGATGAQGIQGEPGATGAQGEQGIQGEKGDPGVMSTEPLAGDSGVSFEYAEVIKFDASTVSGTILHTPGSENIVIMSPGRYVVSFGVYIDGFLGEIPENAVAGFAVTANTGLYLPVFSVLPYGEITGTFIIDATAVSEFSPMILSVRCVSTCETNLANVSKQAYITCYSFDGTNTITAFLNKAS